VTRQLRAVAAEHRSTASAAERDPGTRHAKLTREVDNLADAVANGRSTRPLSRDD
jgi:hypothetical protein